MPQRAQEIAFRRNHADEMKLIRLSAPVQRHRLVVHIEIVEARDLHFLVRPKRRIGNDMGRYLLHRRIVNRAVEDFPPVGVHDPEHHPRRQHAFPVQQPQERRRRHPVGVLPKRPFFRLRRQRLRQLLVPHDLRALHGAAHLRDAVLQIHFRLMIDGEIKARNGQNARQQQNADQDHRVDQHQLRRDAQALNL